MSNGSTIRTMKDDLNDVTNNKNQKTEEKKVIQDTKEIRKANSLNMQPEKNNLGSMKSVSLEKPTENILQKNDIARDESILPDDSIIRDDCQANNFQDDQLASLIKKAKSDKDKDAENKVQKIVERVSPTTNYNKMEIESMSLNESKNSEDDEKHELLKKVIEDQNIGSADIGGGNIDDLKNLISKISKPSIPLKKNSIKADLKNEKISVRENTDGDFAKKSDVISEKSKISAVSDAKRIEKDDKKRIDAESMDKVKTASALSQNNNIVSEPAINNAGGIKPDISLPRATVEKKDATSNILPLDDKITSEPISADKVQSIATDLSKEDAVVKVDKQNIKADEEDNKKFQWSDLAKKINGDMNKNKIDRIDDIKKESSLAGTTTKAAETLKSGILDIKKDNQKKGQKEKDDKFDKEQSLSSYSENYISPNERLIHGKQEFYSSVSKVIRHKEKNDDIKALKEDERIKNAQNNVLTKDEEYKKLKKGIIRKYNIKLTTLPWKKIIPVGALFIVFVGVAAFLLFSREKVEPVVKPPVVISGIEIEKFSNMTEITMDEHSLKLGDSSEEASEEFNESVKVVKLRIIYDGVDNNMLILEDALSTILKKDRSYFYDGFFEATTGNYNIFIFQTEKKTMRYGLAIQIKEDGLMQDIMRQWEADRTNDKRIISVFEKLFIDDANGYYGYTEFSSVGVMGIEINYAHLKGNRDTALNYFIHDNILIITTSMDSNSTMIDLVTSN
ncbi:hypothetical protein KAJ41_00710 [Candidatus Parcubacteria bacterium]|nr:hypothetical protein [Candidatus Parcubacteria bacterium]